MELRIKAGITASHRGHREKTDMNIVSQTSFYTAIYIVLGTYENSNRRRQREDARNGDSGSTTPESYHYEDRRIRRGGVDR